MTKDAIRQKVWNRITLAGVASFPSPHGRVPNFIGCERAATLLSSLTLWKRARVVVIGSGAPQLPVRRAALRDGKTVYLMLPGLRTERCFIELDAEALGSRAWRAASVRGARQLGRLVSPQDVRCVDLILMGSVAVTRQGARLGRGNSGSDLAYALLRQAGKVREYTPIMTTIHPLQIVDERIPMRAHDVPVDFLVTPEQVVAAPSLYPRPRGILWDLLSEERIRSVPILRKERRDARQTRAPRQL